MKWLDIVCRTQTFKCHWPIGDIVRIQTNGLAKNGEQASIPMERKSEMLEGKNTK